MFDGWRFGDGVNNGVEDDDDFGYVETDPTGRYGRFNDVLGKGATKTVYRAFDEVAGMEVAWNQVRVVDVMRSPEELQRLYSEMHLLRTLDHDSVIKMYASWIDPQTRTINFITEMFTSGTLRGYRKKYKHVGMRVIKNWSRQILRGLVYLHTHDPPIIHRDLKCDNIFVNGHLGEVKIGDLGLAAILHQTHAAHSVIGTPEFMAPELYEEEYNELVDIYSFGMCVLEMLTSEYPYAECTNPAQIYKKVTSGKKPGAFLRIEDPEARRFVGRCLESAPNRATAEELLQDSFLASDDEGVPEYVPATPRPCSAKKPAMNPAPTLAQVPAKVSSTPTSPTAKPKPMQAKQATTTDMTVTGNLKPDDDDTIFLTFQIGDKHGCIRNVHFPFDIVKDTPMEVAVEMVKELEISDRDASEIAAMIETEIIALVPNLKVDLCEVDQDSVAFEYDSAGEDSSSFSDPRTPKYQKSVIDWLQDQPDTDEEEDKSSQSSNFSGHYSNWSHISSNNETAVALCFEGGEFGGVGNWLTPSQKTHDPTVHCRPGKSSRFYPGGVDIPVPTRKCNIGKPSNPVSGRSMTDGIWSGHNGSAKTRSSVDYGSQFSQVSLLEEMKRQRMYKTIGAVEGIGYREPIGVHGAWGHATSWFSGRSQRQHRFA